MRRVGISLIIVSIVLVLSSFMTATNPCAAEVDLLSFKIKIDKDMSLVSWISVAESNLEFYVLERSTDNNDFEEVTKVQASVNSQSIIRYEVKDIPKAEQSILYRLKVVDAQGNGKYVNVVQMQNAQISQLASK